MHIADKDIGHQLVITGAIAHGARLQSDFRRQLHIFERCRQLGPLLVLGDLALDEASFLVTADLAPRLAEIAYDTETRLSDHQPVVLTLRD